MWLMNQPEGVFGSWTEVYNKFIMKYYLPHKTGALRKVICAFEQMDGEAFHEAWERFDSLLRQYPYHELPLSFLATLFYDSIHSQEQSIINSMVGGDVGKKMIEEICDIYELLAMSSQ